VLARFDDLIAAGLRAVIDHDPSLTVVAADIDGRRLAVVLRAHRPDVAILDVEALADLAEIRRLSAAHPATRLVALVDHPSAAECSQLLAFGASACLGREAQARDLLHAIHLAARGLQLMPRMVSGDAVRSRPILGGHLLTPREADVLPLLQLNRSNAQIAVELGVGVETIRTHARNIYRKLGIASRRELTAPRAPEPASAESTPARTPPRSRRTAPHARARRGSGLRRD
jgi:DNA-binding NarL/FixJ family response regulator